MPVSRPRRIALAGVGTAALLATAVPAFAASVRTETLTNYKISGLSSARHGQVKFIVKNQARIEHQMIVIKTKTHAAKLHSKNGRAVEKGSVGQVEVVGGQTKTLKLNLKKGHYALICNIGNHYMEGMHKDFTVK